MIYQDVLEALFRASRYRRYLELGIGDGSMFRRIAPHAEVAVAVDVEARALDKLVKATGKFHGTTRDFFAQQGGVFDMVFVDADHASTSVREDLRNALTVLAPGGVVALHDTDPSEPRYLHPSHCNDAWRVAEELEAGSFGAVEHVTLPVGHEGLTLVQKRGGRRVQRSHQASP